MADHEKSLHERLASEIRSVFHLTLYFGVWFSALNLLLHETLGHTGLPLEAWGFAWIKAALCAKFLLVGQLLLPMPDISRDRVWSTILPRSFGYLLVVIFLSVLEEGVRGLLHGHPFMQTATAFVDSNPLRFFALAWVYWMILVPYLVVTGLLVKSAPQAKASH
jgi:hypothetical protein